MAFSLQPYSWANGFRAPAERFAWQAHADDDDDDVREDDFVVPPHAEELTSTVHNSVGLNYIRTWPTLLNGTKSPHGLPPWWRKQEEVDVLIVGAGPAGLQVGVSLARQGVSFRIIDKQTQPLVSGRADGVQPRFLELLSTWGLADEVSEEGPLIAHTAIYKDGKQLFFDNSHQSDSRYRGLHIITQGQLERIYVRDLARHKVLVERETELASFDMDDGPGVSHPITARVSSGGGAEEVVKAKFMVGADGASSKVRKGLGIGFDGTSTDIYWGILDCKWASDYPHLGMFGSIISSKYGGCVCIPREEGYLRIYVQLDTSSTGSIAQNRQGQNGDFSIEGGRVDVHSITAEEVLAQANKIFAPYTLKFASSLSWFAVWKISERVARSFVSENNRVFLAGDAAHIHSVMGAFGLNASMMDSANLAWKLGLAARGRADHNIIMPTYDSERRLHAHRIIRVSGNYLRFVCQSKTPLAEFHREFRRPEWPGMPTPIPYDLDITDPEEKRAQDGRFLKEFFGANGPFLLGLELDTAPTVLSRPIAVESAAANGIKSTNKRAVIAPAYGVRAPNPRLIMPDGKAGYLYDTFVGASTVSIVVFVSDLRSQKIRASLKGLSDALIRPATTTHINGSAKTNGHTNGHTKSGAHEHWFWRHGGASAFRVVLVTKSMAHEVESEGLLDGELAGLSSPVCTLLFDDRTPDEDAHTTYGVDYTKGAVVVVRPDLIIGTAVALHDTASLGPYFASWLKPAEQWVK